MNEMRHSPAIDPDGCEPCWATAMEVASISTKAGTIQIVLRFFILILISSPKLGEFQDCFFRSARQSQ
jgi:hypothetical protein